MCQPYEEFKVSWFPGCLNILCDIEGGGGALCAVWFVSLFFEQFVRYEGILVLWNL